MEGLEKFREAFGEQFWKFIRETGYRPEKRKHKEGEPPKYELYRFLDGKAGYPEIAPESIVRCINDFVDSIHRN